MKKIAIIGAGISGLFFANLLRQDSKHKFVIFEKNESITLDKGYGVQLSVNSTELLNKINFKNFNNQNYFNPEKIDFYSLSKKKKICDLNISNFNNKEAKYLTIKRENLINFLKEKLPSNFIQYNKKIVKINSSIKNIDLFFEDNSSEVCDYLIISDGIFSPTKSILFKKKIEPEYSKSLAIRGTLNKKDLKDINKSNISIFLGSNLHFVIYPLNKHDEFNFVGIVKKKLNKIELNNHRLFDKKYFQSMIVSKMSQQIDKNILDNLKNVKCFPTFMSNKIYLPKQKKIFILGDAFYAFPPTFAQGASQSIEAAYDLYEMFENNGLEFNKKRLKRTKMISKRSNFNYFAFHLSNPLMIFFRDILIKYFVRNKKFLNNYLGKIYFKK